MSFRLRYLPAFDGLRALAALTVLVGHAAPAALPGGGGAGVDLFFVLSGFLITVLLLQEHHDTGAVSFSRFYLRRALRLFPAMAALLVLYGGYRLLGGHGTSGGWNTLLAAGAYVANWVRAFHGAGAMGDLGHTWSLAMEEQFYLLWPPFLALLLRAPGSRNGKLAVVAGLTLASALWRFVIVRLFGYGDFWQDRLYNGFDTRADGLLLGCLLGMALCWKRLPEWLTRPMTLRAMAASGLVTLTLLVAGPFRNTTLVLFQGYALASLASVGILLFVLFSPQGTAVRCLEWHPLVWVGRLSYGLYLWHYPLFEITRRTLPFPQELLVPTQLALALGVAALAYYLLERPFLRLKDRFRSEPATERQPTGNSDAQTGILPQEVTATA